ncbi:hypothetical protein EDB89DRAFT_1948704 [Lactarius sanguifluus]|nr:hypothetical protein EDB89DRAFT_1948704 [Lactarius sanguifluus]
MVQSLQTRPASVADSGIGFCECYSSDSELGSCSVDRKQGGPLTPLSPSPADLVHDAYRRLTFQQLYLFCSVRSLPTAGTQLELASRLAHHDLRLYPFPSTSPLCNPDAGDARPADPRPFSSPDFHSVGLSSPDPSDGVEPVKSKFSMHDIRIPCSRASYISPLPVEIMAEIMDQVGDWELTKAVGLPTSLPQPLSWARASPTDHALLTGFLPLLVSCEPALRPPTSVGVRLVVRFSYIHILIYLHRHCRSRFGEIFRHHIIPITAAHHGRVDVLDWWQSMHEVHPEDFPIPNSRAIIDAIDGASRAGQVESLEWWLKSGLPFEYTEAALEHASAKNQLAVLEWWREQRARLPLKVGRVMDTASAAGHVAALTWWAHSGVDFTYDRQALYHASCHGHIDVLQWWLDSGLQLFYDQDVLIGATRYNRPEVLQWWDKSGLPVQYRMCDIEEALEDAIGAGERARKWWKGKGVDFNTNDKEWTKLQNLN